VSASGATIARIGIDQDLWRRAKPVFDELIDAARICVESAFDVSQDQVGMIRIDAGINQPRDVWMAACPSKAMLRN
jgi:hypothetical protein